MSDELIERHQMALAFAKFTSEIYRQVGVETELLEAEHADAPKWEFGANAKYPTGFRVDMTEASFPPLADWQGPIENAVKIARILVNEWPHRFSTF